MLEVIVAFDENDVELGAYFEGCKENLLATIAQLIGLNVATSEVPAQRCNQAYLDVALKRLRDYPFIIAAYMHGNESELVVRGNGFVRAGNDNSYFQDTFFYTNSCSCGKYLGPDLIAQNCRTFIGFDQKISALLDHNFNLSIQCDNHGLIAFLAQDITAFEAFEQMRLQYSQASERVRKFGDILSASILINTREALVFHGEKDLKKENLFIHDSYQSSG